MPRQARKNRHATDRGTRQGDGSIVLAANRRI